jgi:GNAT superfamily N-acetyltransferase
MYWRQTKEEFERLRGQGSREALRSLVDGGTIPGILAYSDDRPIGWVSVGPREDFRALERSRVLKPVDDQPVWSVVCFFVAKAFRHRGLTVELLKAAASHAKLNGARILEGYPSEPKSGQPDPFVYTGVASAFRRAGFDEVAKRSPSRPIMRLYLDRSTGLEN